MIDVGARIRWDVTDAVRRTQAFDKHAIDWLEEPLGAWDPEGRATLRSTSSARLAYGEREWTVAGFERVMATATCDVVGVDPARAEGITGLLEVARRAEAYRRQANAHVWPSAICTAASLAVSFARPACKVIEFKPLENPMQHELVTHPFGHEDGWVARPTGTPGLGIEVVDEVVVVVVVVDRYRLDRS